MQVSVKNADLLASLLTDHSPVLFSCFKNDESNKGRGFWKFNNSLIENEEYVIEYVKETRNSSKIRPLDFEKKMNNSEKCFVKYQ